MILNGERILQTQPLRDFILLAVFDGPLFYFVSLEWNTRGRNSFHATRFLPVSIFSSLHLLFRFLHTPAIHLGHQEVPREISNMACTPSPPLFVSYGRTCAVYRVCLIPGEVNESDEEVEETDRREREEATRDIDESNKSEPHPYTIKMCYPPFGNVFDHEVDVYNRLEPLQDEKLIPRVVTHDESLFSLVFEYIDTKEKEEVTVDGDIITRLVQTLKRIHSRGVIHCDVRLSNVLVPRSEGNKAALLCDFGYSSLVDDESGTHSKGLRGFGVSCAPLRLLNYLAGGGSLSSFLPLPRDDICSLLLMYWREQRRNIYPEHDLYCRAVDASSYSDLVDVWDMSRGGVGTVASRFWELYDDIEGGACGESMYDRVIAFVSI